MTTLLISGGTLVDGTGAAGYPGWVAVEGSTISAVGAADAPAPAADRVVDATGRVVTPGFIDVHSHSDFVVVALPELTSSVAQGITTMVVGNCGSSPAPLAERTRFADLVAQLTGEVLPGLPEVGWQSFGEFLDAVQAARPAVNVAALVGFGALRSAVVADPTRPADADEVAQMRRLLAACLDEGAIGMSTGLIYDPDRSASREEVVEVARELRGRGRYASHIRGEGAELWAAVSEAITLAREVRVPVQVSHLKLEGSAVWGQPDRLLGMLAAARAEGLLVEGDQYPYAAYETSLSAFFPAWAIAGDLPELLAGPDAQRLRTAVERGEDDWQSSVDGVGWDRIVVARHRDDSWAGRSIDSYENACRLLVDDPTCSVVGHAMQEEDVRAILAAPEVSICTDSAAAPGDGSPLDGITAHPRGFGTYPLVLGHYVRDQGLLSLEAAVRKMTSLPAAQLGLSGRGVLAVGAAADLVVLDPATVGSPATFLDPYRFPVGIETVVVNGAIAVEGSEVVGRYGRVLR